MGADASVAASEPIAPLAAGRRRQRDTILVVEDNAVNQRVIEAMLAKRGLQRRASPATAARRCRCSRCARTRLVFMDCQMPEMDGYAATAAIRSREPGDARLPIVAMTAHAMKGDRERCLAAGMDDYLSKPLRPEELDALLERWLGAPGRAPRPRTRRPWPRDPFDALVDDARMRVFRVDYPEIVDQLVELFVESTPPLLDELRAGAEAGDGDAVRRTAHKLKGSCQNIGAGFMAKLAHDLELASAAAPERARRARPRVRRHPRRAARGAAGGRRDVIARPARLAAVAVADCVAGRAARAAARARRRRAPR